MNKFLFLVLIAASGSAWAQDGMHVVTANPMPDGSRDTYLGLGVQSAPRWEGADTNKQSALPVLQVQWSSGLFISGMSAGMHLSDNPTVEYGPLLSLLRGRGEGGTTGSPASGIGNSATLIGGPRPIETGAQASGARLAGMDDIRTRVLAGAFVNYYLDPAWRLTSSVLYGAGNERDGARLDLGVQRLATGIGAHHRVALSAGVGIVNRRYAQAYFGVSGQEASRSRFAEYAAGGGLNDAHVGLRWNWDWTPSWMLTTNVQATRLLGSARNSPLVERPTNLTASTAVAYRF